MCYLLWNAVDDVSKLRTLKADVLGIFGTKDKHINPQVVEKFQANMKETGKKLTVYNYDADHGFANPSNPIYDKTASSEAFGHVVKLFKDKLK